MLFEKESFKLLLESEIIKTNLNLALQTYNYNCFFICCRYRPTEKTTLCTQKLQEKL